MNNREMGNKDSNQLAAEIPFASVKAWFFDLDGTLMNTDDQAVDSLTHRLRFLGSSSAQRLARLGRPPGRAVLHGQGRPPLRHEPAEHLHEVPPEQGCVLRPLPQLRRRQSQLLGLPRRAEGGAVRWNAIEEAS